MHGIAGHENAAVTVTLGDQQVMAPRDNVQDLKVAGKADQILNNRNEVGVFRQRGMQGELLAVALSDNARPGSVGKLIVASLSSHDALIQIIRPEDHLNEVAKAAPALPV